MTSMDFVVALLGLFAGAALTKVLSAYTWDGSNDLFLWPNTKSDARRIRIAFLPSMLGLCALLLYLIAAERDYGVVIAILSFVAGGGSVGWSVGSKISKRLERASREGGDK